MVIDLTPEQSALVSGLIHAKAVAERELTLVLSTLLSGPWPGAFKGVTLEGNQLRFLDAD